MRQLLSGNEAIALGAYHAGMVMLGSLSVFLELEAAASVKNIRHRLLPRFVEFSIEAFLRGAEDTKAMIKAKETVR